MSLNIPVRWVTWILISSHKGGRYKWLRGLLEVTTFSDAGFFYCNISSVVIMQWGGTHDQNNEIVLGLMTPSEQVGFIKQMEKLFFTCKRIIHT